MAMTPETTGQTSVTYVSSSRTWGVPFLFRVIWFLLIGWWLGPIFIVLGYAFTVLLVTIPLGWWFLNRIGRAMTLMPATNDVIIASNMTEIVAPRTQIFWPFRLIYTFVIGLWIGLMWLSIAYVLCLSILLMPFGLWMINRAPTVITLELQ
jgi:uncharacterized membrane protein YccF (DUF307 family)